MKIPFPFDPLLTFGFMASMLLVGIILRGKMSLLQRFLIPSCLIGGMVGLVLISLELVDIKIEMLEAFAYHLFNISFISVGLTPRSEDIKSRTDSREIIKGAFWMALMQSIMFPIQAIAGGLLIFAFNSGGMGLYKTFGFLAPLGFIQGPGQALSIGKAWETVGFEHAATIGLTFAAIGYLFAFAIGVPMVNRGIRQGRCENLPEDLPQDVLKGYAQDNQEKESAGELTMHSGNVETLAFQMALIGIVYLATYFVIKNIGSLLQPKLATTLWGFFFFVGLIIALLVRIIMQKIGISHMINPGIQKRITGWAVDFMIVATVLAVQVVIVWKFIIPITVISLITGLTTTVISVYFGNRLLKFRLERTVAIYGTLTGTVSTGLLLLRIADPEFRTTVALELAFMIMFVSPVILACMLFVSAPVVWGWSMTFTLSIFTGILTAALIILKATGFWGKKEQP